MIRLLRRLYGETKGQALPEAALVMPLILMLIFGALIFGMLVNAKLAVSGAAREAARYWGINHASMNVDVEARNVAEQYLKGAVLIDTTGMTCSLTATGRINGAPQPPDYRISNGAGCRVEIDDVTYADPFGGGPPDMVAVRVTFWHPTIVGGLLGLEDTIPISSTVVFRVEK